MSPLTTFSKVEIHGSGLIGTSIGLALVANGVEVRMVDSDSRAQGLAQELVGPIMSKPFLADLVISAVPISAFRSVIVALEGANFSGGFIDVASVKAKPKVEVTTSRLQPSRFLPTHPMAGREVGGAESARSDLFEGRTWIIDSQEVDGDVLAMGRELISTLGADSIDLPSDEHDKAVALISHLPQIIASILAKQLGGKPESWLTLAGSGLRDTTRIAASDPKLWREIISANAAAIEPLLRSFSKDLSSLLDHLSDENVVEKVIADGVQGRSAIPGKHGGKVREYTYLPIVIEDKPGQLAAIFNECAKAEVNVEDLSIEHSPGQETGLITLALSSSDAKKLAEHLSSAGWSVHTPRG
jgi:prephenate dehydrogenase